MKIAALLSFFLFFSCTHLFFQPDHFLYAPPEKLNLTYENILFDSKDGTRLHSWFLHSPIKEGREGLVVLFHGNAQNLSSHYLSVSWLVQYGYDVWVWDYRGYGLSQGEANSRGVYEDAQAALGYVEKLYSKKDYKNLILVGQSLGGNILTRALSEYPYQDKVDLLVLDSTFLSYQEMAKNRLKSVWFLWPFNFLSSLLISDEYSAKGHIKKIKIPTLVIHGKKDPVVPFIFGEEIYRELEVNPKDFWAREEGKHIDTLGNSKGDMKEEFLKLIGKLLDSSSS